MLVYTMCRQVKGKGRGLMTTQENVLTLSFQDI